VLEAVGLLIPFVMVFALPMGMMTASLLVFGRFSADQELTAVRSSGISLVALVTPILILSLFLCGFSAWINLEAGPQCRVAYLHLIREMGLKLTATALPEGRYVKQTFNKKNYMFYLGRNDGKTLRDVYICGFDTNQPPQPDLYIYAPRGTLQTTNDTTSATLYDQQTLTRREDGVWMTGFQGRADFPLNGGQTNDAYARPALSDMTLGQLRAELRGLEQGFSARDERKLTTDELRAQKRKLEHLKKDVTMPARVQLNLKVATSFACFGFTLVGIPLGIRAHRRETNVGLAMALGLAFVYYAFVIVGQSLQSRAEFAPYLIVWMPNFLFQAIGGVMLWRANKGI
jgi:lipopolysaccharide export system permease protein